MLWDRGISVNCCISINQQLTVNSGRLGGLMVSALDSKSRGLGSTHGRGTVLCSWAKHFTLIVPFFTQVYRYWRIYCCEGGGGVTLRWTSIPSRGEQKYSQSLHAKETGLNSGLGPVSRKSRKLFGPEAKKWNQDTKSSSTAPSSQSQYILFRLLMVLLYYFKN